MAFSQGAILAATLMIRHQGRLCHPGQEDVGGSESGSESMTMTTDDPPPTPPFKCAIFLCGGVPGDPAALEQGKVRMLDYEVDGEVIDVPTAHIWGGNDPRKSTSGPVLSKLCKVGVRTVYVHNGGHEVPGPRDQVALNSTVAAIQKTIDMVLSAQ